MRSLELTPPPGCSLSQAQVGEQRGRARRLAPAVAAVARVADTLHVTFDEGVDGSLLDELIATERTCCSFLEIGYDERERDLSIRASDEQGREVVSRFHSFFSEVVR